MPPLYLPTGPAKHTGLVVQRPTLLVFYHVEKTGGSAVMKWLHRMTRAPARLSMLMDFTHTSCFFAMHPALFPDRRKDWDARRCVTQAPPRWQSSAIAVEFHAYSAKRYWRVVEPQLAAMRRQYAALNGTVVTVASFREPMAHALSVYRMWPPQDCGASSQRGPRGGCRGQSKHVRSLPAWLPGASALQAGSLTADSVVSQRRGFQNARGCAVLPEALERLGRFDVVGVSECMHGLVTALCEAMGWPCVQDEARLAAALAFALRHTPHGVQPGGVLWREARVWSLATLNDSTRALVRRAAECDARLYAAALTRLRLPPPAVPGVALETSLCSRAQYSRRGAVPADART